MNWWVRMPESAAQTRYTQDYSGVLAQLGSALSNEPSSKTFTTSARLLRESSDHFDWVGIYLLQENDLVLEAYAGDEETEHVRIPIGQGICGSAAKEAATIVAPDVSKDAGYLMCFPSTRSEIVVPIKGLNHVLGEIDIDGSRFAAFNWKD
jgi:GAF domain-containing protein